jgi:hypothetical protein
MITLPRGCVISAQMIGVTIRSPASPAPVVKLRSGRSTVPPSNR